MLSATLMRKMLMDFVQLNQNLPSDLHYFKISYWGWWFNVRVWDWTFRNAYWAKRVSAKLMQKFAKILIHRDKRYLQNYNISNFKEQQTFQCKIFFSNIEIELHRSFRWIMSKKLICWHLTASNPLNHKSPSEFSYNWPLLYNKVWNMGILLSEK